MQPDLNFDADLALLRHVSKRALAAIGKMKWRAGGQVRSTRTFLVLSGIRNALGGDSVVREKQRGAWRFVIDGAVVAIVVTACPGKTIEDLIAPLSVYVDEDRVVDRAPLDRLLERGDAVLVDRVDLA